MSLLSPPSLDELRSAVENQVIIITGAAQGIGFAIAQTLAIAGAQVILTDLDADRGGQALSEIGHGALFVPCDVTSWNDQCRLFRTAMVHFGRIDTVICNAGVNPELTLGARADFFADQLNLSVDPQDNESNGNQPSPLSSLQRAIFEINTLGPLYGIRLAMQYMKQDTIGDKGRRIVVIGSAASYLPVPEQPLYCASKHAALGLVRAVAQRPECTTSRIAISMVSPWFTQTPMTRGVSDEAVAGFPVSRAQDIAAAVSATLTQSTTFINGKCIWVRGEKCIEVEDGVSQCLANMML